MTYLRRHQIEGVAGQLAQVDTHGKLKVSEPYRVLGSSFVGTTIDASFWSSTVANSGTFAQANSLVTLASSATASGRSVLRTTRAARFITFNQMVARMNVLIPTVVVDHNTRRWGVFTETNGDPVNGFYFELSSAGVLSVNSRNAGGSVNSVASESFNGDVTEYTVDTNIHSYEIAYSAMRVEFWIDGMLIHTMRPTTTNLTAVYTLPMSFVTINDATGGVSGTMQLWAANCHRLGLAITQPRSSFTTGTQAGVVLKRGPGSLQQLMVSNVTNSAAITVYDNTAASGTILWASGAMGSQTQPFLVDLNGVPFETGLTVVVSGAAANLLVLFE